MDESDVVHVPIESEDRSRYSLDCSLARAQLGWEPARTLYESATDRLDSEA